MKPLVIYHANCWDGFCAAWVARGRLGDIDAHPAQYGTDPPEVTGRDVYVLDFCYPTGVMRRLQRDAASLVVLDHHPTARAAVEAVGGTLGEDVSGGRMAWDYWYPTAEGCPWLVSYTEDRDLWRHALPHTREINAALRSHPLDFALWDQLHHAHLDDLACEGRAILRRERQIVTEHVRNAVEIEMAGHRVRSVNATVMFSEIAGELAKGCPFGACWFQRSDGKRQWSLRSDDDGVDVSAIAKARGGGGHVHAAGFEEDSQ